MLVNKNDYFFQNMKIISYTRDCFICSLITNIILTIFEISLITLYSIKPQYKNICKISGTIIIFSHYIINMKTFKKFLHIYAGRV